MPLYYNQAVPTPKTKNTINSVTIDIRDYLLTKNLAPQYPTLGTSINGSPKGGEPVLDTMAGSGTVVVPDYLPLETNGITFKNKIIVKNTFINKDLTADFLSQINDITKIKNTDYLNSYWPEGQNTYPIGPTDEVTKYGIIGKTNEADYRKKNVIKNLYLDMDKQIDMAVFIDFNIPPITKQLKSYRDEYGDLNLGGSGFKQAVDTVGSILNGQGIGFSKSGLVTNFDLRSSLAGRILGATGIIHDTKLGIIGGQQLALALANNAAFNVQQDLLGTLNISNNILSYIKSGTLEGFRADYKITVATPTTLAGKILKTSSKILGFVLPRSELSDSGSIFQTESLQVRNIDRANSMLMNTGSGQFQALLKNVQANLNGISPFALDNPSLTIFRTGYAPAYKDNKGVTQVTSGEIYAYSNEGITNDLLSSTDGITFDLNSKKDIAISDYGFKSPDEYEFAGHRSSPGYNERKISDIQFSWGSEQGGTVNGDGQYSALEGSKKSLLVKTQELFNSVGMVNIVTAKGDMHKKSSQIETANGGGFSKGNAVLQAQHFTSNGYLKTIDASARPEDVYCRSWTTIDRYDKVRKLVRHHGLWDNSKIPFRPHTDGSVLGKYGFPKIAPYITDNYKVDSKNQFTPQDPKRFMLSLENLAWCDDLAYLPSNEIGAGDLSTNKKGRIMWFPPYDIAFSESSSVNWEASNFIGRGESVYTYNNTERSGNLSFSVIVDHPNYANAFRGHQGPDDHYINSFWAGCIDPNSEMGKRLKVNEISDALENFIFEPTKSKSQKEKPLEGLVVYFANDNYTYDTKYENGLSGSSFNEWIDYNKNKNGEGFGLKKGSEAQTTQEDVNGVHDRWPDRYNWGLNYSVNSEKTTVVKNIPNGVAPLNVLHGFYDPNRVAVLAKHLTQTCPHCKVIIQGYASQQGVKGSNIKLGTQRSDTVKAQLMKELTPYLKKAGLKDNEIKARFVALKGIERSSPKCPKQEPDNKKTTKREDKPPTDSIYCKMDRKATVSLRYSPELAKKESKKNVVKEKKKQTKTKTFKTTINKYNEALYFEELTNNDPFIFDSFREKIRYFHPAFHSTTPEGLNSRLTFLLQCTRQGKTLETQGADNLAFGRPPVCILRIGDFYNTKIIIDNVNFEFEPLVWDINPEGIGVQPMIAKVNISFKFIGGSSLLGPIQRLQNALSFNYFANTQVYDTRADYYTKNKGSHKVDAKAKGVKDREFSTYDLNFGPLDTSGSIRHSVVQTVKKELVPKQNQKVNSEDVNQETPETTEVGTSDLVYIRELILRGTDSPIIEKSDNKNEWGLPLQIYASSPTLTTPEAMADLLLSAGTWSFMIKDVNSKESYQTKISYFTMVQCLTKGINPVTFIVPIKGKAFSTTNTTGIKDSFGKENFMVALMMDNKIYQGKQINIKLK